MSDGRRTKFYLILGFGGLLFALIAVFTTLNYLKIGVAKKRADDGDAAKVRVLVAVDPLAFLVERIGGDRVVVSTLTPPGKDPETFAPTPAKLGELASTQLFLRVGLPVEERFAKNVESIAPNVKSIDLREGFELLPDEHEHHSETEETLDNRSTEEHSEALDPHLWTSPAAAREIVRKTALALQEESPENAAFFLENATVLDAELAALQSEISTRLKPFEGRMFVVFHPAYGYFANEFHLTQRAIESEGKAPRPRELVELIELAKREKVRAAIVQPEFDRSSAQVVANAIGAELVDHSPLEKDYFANLRSLTDAIERSLEPQK